MIFESCGVLSSAYAIYTTNEINKTCSKIEEIYDTQMKNKKENVEYTIECKEAVDVFENSSYFVKKYIEFYRLDIVNKLKRLLKTTNIQNI